MNISKSKYCNALQCMKMLWLDEYKPEVKVDENNQSTLENGTNVGILARELFGKFTNVEFDSNLNNMITRTNELINNNKDIVITEASFKYLNSFCSIDILVKHNDTYQIYEVKSSTSIKDIYIDDISYQYYILSNLGFKVDKASIVYINNQYERNGDLDLNKLFKIEDVTNQVIDKQTDVKLNIDNINEYMMQKNEPKDDIDTKCVKPYDCPYFNYCTRELDKPNIFDLPRLKFKDKIKFYKDNIYKFNDLLTSNLNDSYKLIIDHELNNLKPIYNINNINNFLKELHYPLYFLDFETYQQVVPEFNKVKPYMQIPFQYSLHYIDNGGGELKHKEFLGDGVNDPRYDLAKQLIEDIPKNACVLAYNMGFEKSRIKELANIYPELRNDLMIIHDNINDLMIPFQKRDYYSRDFKGLYTIKYVLPSLFPNDPSLDYHNLNMVHRGTEAMEAYANLHNLNDKDKKELIYNMLKYCELDTYAMVKIWEFLTDLSEKEKVKGK